MSYDPNNYYKKFFEGYDPSYKLSFKASWADHEEDGWIFIFEKNDQYYSIDGGHCVMVEDCTKPTWQNNLCGPLTLTEAIEIMSEWEGKEDDLEDVY